MSSNFTGLARSLKGSRLKRDLRTSKMGYEFDSSEDIWQLDGSTKLNLGRMRDIDHDTAEGLRKHYADMRKSFPQVLPIMHLDSSMPTAILLVIEMSV